MLEDPVWFAPKNIVYHFAKLMEVTPESKRHNKDFRKASEMNSVAIALLGIQTLQGQKYWLQAVSDTDRSPDVRTGTFVLPTRTKADDFSVQDVEVVTLGKYSEDKLLDFLKNTKLSKNKSYDAKTTILCAIERDTALPPLHQCREAIARTGADCTVVILGKISPTHDIYKTAHIYPRVELEINFDLSKAFMDSHTGVLRLERGTKPRSIYLPDEKHYPFEKLGLHPLP